MNTRNYLTSALIATALLSGCKKDGEKAAVIPEVPENTAFVTRLFEYVPAPGQFINLGAGRMEAAQSILKKEGIVSLGAWGGYIVLGFDHTVVNRKDLPDILLKGNAQSNFAEPGVVWVMKDDNKNGQPDDTWYEIAGSEFGKDGYIRNYEVTYTKPTPVNGDVSWKDNKGNTGLIEANTFHSQSYFPDWISGAEYTLKGTLLPSSNINMTNPAFVTSLPFAFGYADNIAGGDQIDIAKAIDKDGKNISLTGIDFIKIQTGIQANMKSVGELSTELTSVTDLGLIK